jgi:DNA-binding IclR family transcriptional regulator
MFLAEIKTKITILALMTPPRTARLAEIARLADMTPTDTLRLLRELRRKDLVMAIHVDEEPDETLWRKA